MASITVKSESVYECDTCSRRIRVPTSKRSFDVVQRCIITADCVGKLHRLTSPKDVNTTPAFPPEVAGVRDWSQRMKLFTHTQLVRSTTWTIQHNMETNPNVYVYVERNGPTSGSTELVEVAPTNLTIVDANTIAATFAQAEQGLAQCIATASQNTVNPQATAGLTAADTDVVLTSAGELTIATLDDSPTISLSLTYNSPASVTPVTVEYLNIGAPSVESAWYDTTSAIINGKRYTIRSFNIINTPLAPSYFSTGTIADGSTAYFPTINIRGQVLILLSNAPYASVDRVFDKYVDASSINDAQPQVYLNSRTLYTAPSIIKSTYPPIIVA